jgi:steroid 5-alpha reductase family enzyme
MKIHFGTIITLFITITISILGFIFGGLHLSNLQHETLIILGGLSVASILYCFVVGELTGNNSQMDKLWSVLPIIYAWVVVWKSNFNYRVLILAILISIWGIRLTINFAKKGAYRLKFWLGKEDYRWPLLRQDKNLNKRWKWALFNLFFISIYQNLLVLAINLPLLAVMESNSDLNIVDLILSVFLLGFILYEAIADRQQMKFQQEKYKLLQQGLSLEDLSSPYNKGFNTQGLWATSRHPNYLGEQAIWVLVYMFTISASVTTYLLFHWTVIGSMFLILLFIGSSNFSESILLEKYKDYKNYCKTVRKYFPFPIFKSK